MLASLDGAIGPLAETRIPVTDEGLLRGDGAFEVARLYGGRPFAMDDHYARLQRTSNGLRLEFDLTALRSEVDALLEEAGPIEGLLRIVLTRGGRRIAMWWYSEPCHRSIRKTSDRRISPCHMRSIHDACGWRPGATRRLRKRAAAS